MGFIDGIGKALTELGRSVQHRPREGGVSHDLYSWIQSFYMEADECPVYWSTRRDKWLREFCHTTGNDLLQGTISTVTGKVATTGWYVEGPEKTAVQYRRTLAERVDFGAGWSIFLQKVVRDYLTQDKGAYIERIRLSPTDRTGAASGFAHFDSARIRPQGNPEFPAVYMVDNTDGSDEDEKSLHRSQLIHIVDSPSAQEKKYNVGFCAVSRALMTARILADIATYERERLSDLPPIGILFINNMSRKQWEDIEAKYSAQQRQQGNRVWRDLLVAFGLDPSLPLTAELLSFRELPEHFDKRVTTEIAIYSFALAFRIDPREIWPVSAGPLGTATEAEIQHMKARTKGSGLILTDLERAFNDDLSLPASLRFKFDYQDIEEDEAYAELRWRNARFLRELWAPPEGSMGQADGIITREEARRWLVKNDLFAADDLMVEEEIHRLEDVKQKSWQVDLGPATRAYSDGRTVRLTNAPQLWRGFSGAYSCECLSCGHKVSSDQHCVDITCPECGGKMRRSNRPGAGRAMPLDIAPVTPSAVAEAVKMFEEEQGGVELL